MGICKALREICIARSCFQTVHRVNKPNPGRISHEVIAFFVKRTFFFAFFKLSAAFTARSVRVSYHEYVRFSVQVASFHPPSVTLNHWKSAAADGYCLGNSSIMPLWRTALRVSAANHSRKHVLSSFKTRCQPYLNALLQEALPTFLCSSRRRWLHQCWAAKRVGRFSGSSCKTCKAVTWPSSYFLYFHHRM